MKQVWNQFEYFAGLLYVHITNNADWAPVGRLVWRNFLYNRGKIRMADDVEKKNAQQPRKSWPPIEAGLFNGSTERFGEVGEAYRINFRNGRAADGLGVTISRTKLELELFLMRAETLVVQDDDCDGLCALECAEEPSAAIETFGQDRGVFFRFAGRPSRGLDVMRPQHEPVVFDAIGVLDRLATRSMLRFDDQTL